MDDIRAIAMFMLWLVGLYLVVKNAGGVSAVLLAFGSAWNSSVKVLQGR